MIVEHKYIKKILITVCVIGLLVISVYGYIFYEIRSQTRGSVMLLETLERDAARRDRFVGIEKTLEGLEDRADTIDSFVVNEDGIVNFLEIIESLGEEEGVLITKKIEQRVSEESSELRLTLSTTGTWQATQNLLALIENLPYSISVSRFSARASDEEGWLGAMEFSVVSNS